MRRWVFQPPVPSLQPGERANFSTEVRPIPGRHGARERRVHRLAVRRMRLSMRMAGRRRSLAAILARSGGDPRMIEAPSKIAARFGHLNSDREPDLKYWRQ
jgi:hypothetical protein